MFGISELNCAGFVEKQLRSLLLVVFGSYMFCSIKVFQNVGFVLTEIIMFVVHMFTKSVLVTLKIYSNILSDLIFWVICQLLSSVRFFEGTH